MSVVVVKQGELGAHVAALRRAHAAVRRELDDLDDALTALQAQWSGEAMHAHAQAHRAWNAAFAELTLALQEAIAAAEESATRFQQAEARARSLW